MALAPDRIPGSSPGLDPVVPRDANRPGDHADGHLWQVDILRLLTFAAVIGVHTIGNTGIALTTGANGTLMVLQFGREIFFSLTAFVLVYAAANRPLPARPFWRKRFTLVLVPYLAWSAIYELVRNPTSHGWSWSHFGYDLVTGTAEYHLYFLLVTMQLYLVFPLLLKFVRRTADHAVGILAVVTVANLGWMAVLQYVHSTSPTMIWFDTRAYELLPTYAMYVLAGAYAAVHYQRIQAFVDRHRRRLLVIAGVSAAVAIGAYVAQLQIMPNYQAGGVLQPAMLASCLAAVIVVYMIGNRWASGQRRGLRLVAVGSEISFGVYLAHPLVLKLLTDHGFGGGEAWAPGPVITFLAYLITVVGATALAYAIHRSPLAFPLGGRRRSQRVMPVRATNEAIPATAASLTPTTGSLITAAAARDPHQLLFVEGATGRALTAGDLDRIATAWRETADAFGDARVGLAVADPLDMISAYLGALASGVTVAPLDPNATASEYAARLATLGISALITDCPEAAAAATIAGCDLWRTGRPGPVQLVARYRGERPSGGRAALIMSSSGTTGAAKTIPLTEANLLATARQVVVHLGLTAEERGYSPLPLFHINALVVGVLASLQAGARLVVDRRFSARTYWSTVAEQGVTWLNAVPGIISILADPATPPPAASMTSVRLARSASAPLAVITLERFEQRTGIPVVETYGMTEAASQITANPIGARRPGSVGLPAGMSVRVAGSDGRPVPAGTVGMVAIRGESVVEEYWSPANDLVPARSAVDADGWLATGDLGHFDDEGYLYLDGRADDVINRSGEKIHPREIEEVLLREPGVMAASVVGRPHPIYGEEPVAFVVPAGELDDAWDLPARLEARCDQFLGRHKQPAEFVLMASLPVGPTGKVRRADLRRVPQEVAST
ncbi:MAG TPA: AMP-binding protein [Acidimicrobiales bacterium]|jgi:acyl-CoA synthetase (AMP-forming)/AMP-acid ligase II/surface polysaccharide O-acyltransferase-like enzyme|nr:AMP-binding protein [Acidimicrobiales bacterium]